MSVMTKSGLGPPLSITSSPMSHVPVTMILTFNTILHQKEPELHAGQVNLWKEKSRHLHNDPLVPKSNTNHSDTLSSCLL